MSNPEKSGQQGDFPNPSQGPPAYEPQELPGSSGLLPSQHDAPQTSGLLPTQQQEYPQQHDYSQQQGYSQPPDYAQGNPQQHEYPPEKQQHRQQHQQQDFPPPPPGPPPVQHQEKQAFPPPPPGPPTQNPHPNPLNANPISPVTPTFGTEHPQHSTQQPQPTENYAIPQYNPAAPVFAPPPTNEPQLGQTTAPTTDLPAAVHQDEHAHKKPGWSERFSQLGLKAAAPINTLAHKLGSQSFLPETLDKECDKAAAILTSFCKKGATADPTSSQVPTSTDPKATETTDGIIDPTKEKPKNRVIVTIPPKVIAKAAGLAIFTTLRAGFQVTGATGSGILIARLPDGSWGPPSGIQVHTVGGGFSIGLDIFDCVCVINSKEALAAFTNTRVSLGSDLAVVAGPYGAGGSVEVGSAMESKGDSKKKEEIKKQETTETAVPPVTETQNLKPQPDQKGHRRSLSASARKPVFSYVKSRGFYAGIQIDGTVVVERKDANAVFYGERVPVGKILKGEVPHGTTGMWPAGARTLLETLKGIDAGALKIKAGKESAPVATPGNVPVTGGVSTSAPAPTSGTGLPAYVDDGVQRPGVGDTKYQYQ